MLVPDMPTAESIRKELANLLPELESQVRQEDYDFAVSCVWGLSLRIPIHEHSLEELRVELMRALYEYVGKMTVLASQLREKLDTR